MSHSSTHHGVGNVWKSGPGGTVTVSSNRSGSFATTVSGGAGMTVNMIVAEVKADASGNATKSTSWGTGYSYTRDIPSGKYGNVQYGTWGHSVAWERYYELPNCTKTQRTTGTAKVANTAHGYRYWSTNS